MATNVYFPHLPVEEQPLIDTTESTDDVIVSFSGIDEYPQVADVQFNNLHEGKVFYKKQCRKNGVTRQMVTNGVVNMKATWGPDQLLKIRGWVRRNPDSVEQFDDKNGDVLICGENNGELNLMNESVSGISSDGYTLSATFSVDLGEIYEGPVQPVFKLAKYDMEKLNRFQIIIQLVFLHGPPSIKFESPNFICCTKKPSPPPSPRPGGGKRPRPADSRGPSTGSPDCFSPYPASMTGSLDSGVSDNSVKFQRILVDELEARTAHITDLVAHDVHIETSKADIAYHLRIKDPETCEELEEGDIVGFYVDEESGESHGETHIKLLKSDNIHSAVHAGVISRSHWLEGHKPSGLDTTTDTVCVIGIVNVKVVGSVENGERIYASRDHPGKAIPQSHMPVGSFLRKKHVLLGMALESKKCGKKLDEVHLVKCFVCVVLDVTRQELLNEIEDLYELNEKRTEQQIKAASKKTWRRLKCYFALSLVILGIIIFILYQWLVPGSMFRYWLCRRGSIPDHNLYFSFQDPVKKWSWDVHGIQFTYEGLQDKVGVSFRRNNETQGTPYYYLNVDRCAYYYSDGVKGNGIGGHKFVGGARILSVNESCKAVYEVVEEDNLWKYIESQGNVNCEPSPKKT